MSKKTRFLVIFGTEIVLALLGLASVWAPKTWGMSWMVMLALFMMPLLVANSSSEWRRLVLRVEVVT